MKWEILKGSEKDFEGVADDVIYVFESFGSKFYSADKLVTKCGVAILESDKKYIIAERRPITEPVVNQQVTTEWDGEGLPPVGALCRYRTFSDEPWRECQVLAWHDNEVWLKRTADGITFTVGNPELFPTLSPEDVARAKVRSEECDKIFSILSGVERQGNRSDMAEAIYDAGYRKVE